jgi:uncharacterized membrane protein YvbJ
MPSVRCAACGAENPPGSQFCATCARRLDDQTGESVARRRATAVAAQTTSIRWVAVLAAGAATVLIVVIVVVLVAFVIH